MAGSIAERAGSRRSTPPAASAKPRPAGVVLNVIPREGSNSFRRLRFISRRERLDAGEQLHATRAGPRPKTPPELIRSTTSTRRAAAASSATDCGSTPAYRQAEAEARSPACGSTRTPATRTPGRWTSTQSRPAFSDGPERNGIARLTLQVTPRNKVNLHWSEQYPSAPNNDRRRHARRRRRKQTAARFPAIAHPAGHVVLADDQPAPARSGLGHVSGPVSQSRAAHRRHAQRPDDPRARNRPLSRRIAEPGLPHAGGRGRRLQPPSDRHAGEHTALALVCHRRAQHEVRVSGRLQQSEPDLHLLQRGHPCPAEQRRAEPAHAGHHCDRLGGAVKYRRATSCRPRSTRRISGRAAG